MRWDSRTLGDLRAWLRSRVEADRFRHCEGVAFTAADLAERNGVSVPKAVAAAYLHDCAKHPTKLLARRALRGTPFRMDALEWELPPLWHCAVGAALAWKVWGIRDAEILAAVRCHTLGAPGMGPLAQVIFVADYVEPGRRFADAPRLRRLAKRNLRQAVLAKCAGVLSHLSQNGERIHPRLVETWNAFLKGEA